jgi:hypothetical protein
LAEPDIADLSKRVELALFSEGWKFIACQSTPQLTNVGSDWSLTLLRSLNDDQPRAATVSLSGPWG